MFAIFQISLSWHIYKYENTDLKGLKRLIFSIKLAIIIALAILGRVTVTEAGTETDTFTTPLPKPAISGKGLFQSSPGHV